MNILKSLAAITLIAIVFTACSDNNGDGSIADSYVGIWNAKDTTDYSGSLTYDSYNFSIAKRDDNSVFFLNFHNEDTTIFTVTETALSYISGASSDYFFTTMVATKSGNTITYSGDDYGYPLSGVATKQ